MGKDSIFIDPQPFAGANMCRAVGINAHRAVRADGCAVRGGEQQRVDHGVVGVGIKFRSGLADSVAGAGNVGAQDVIANGGGIVDWLAKAGGDKLRGNFGIKIRMVELPLDRFDQLRGLPGVFQPADRFADVQGIFGRRFDGKGFKMIGQFIQVLLVESFGLRIVYCSHDHQHAPQCRIGHRRTISMPVLHFPRHSADKPRLSFPDWEYLLVAIPFAAFPRAGISASSSPLAPSDFSRASSSGKGLDQFGFHRLEIFVGKRTELRFCRLGKRQSIPSSDSFFADTGSSPIAILVVAGIENNNIPAKTRHILYIFILKFLNIVDFE